MIYQIILQPEFKQDLIRHKKAGDKKLLDKIIQLIDEITNSPRSDTGKPELLKGYTNCEMWSRRINQKHRLIYQIKENELIIIAISAYGHYGDK